MRLKKFVMGVHKEFFLQVLLVDKTRIIQARHVARCAQKETHKQLYLRFRSEEFTWMLNHKRENNIKIGVKEMYVD